MGNHKDHEGQFQQVQETDNSRAQVDLISQVVQGLSELNGS
jgi:hypothetical protein